MKKIISILIVLTMLITLPFVASALTPEEPCLYNDPRLDLTQYTLEQVLEMSPEELNVLLSEFERVYDPFGSYARRQEENQDSAIAPRWTTSEDADSTHAYITTQACGILINDMGFFINNNTTEQLNAVFSIAVASNLPDNDETDLGTFAGHFYDPNTGKNYLGITTNTAKSNAITHYQDAYAAAGDNDLSAMYEKIGRCLHYIQDINVPHHAGNVISTGPSSSHGRFETLAETNIHSYISNLNTLSSDNYTVLAGNYVRDIIDIAATDAKSKLTSLENSDPESETWNTIARYCSRKAVKYSTVIMYKLGQRSDVPFYYN